MSQMQAINTAAIMAASDGLLDAEVVRFQNGQGELSIDLSRTFALGVQDQGKIDSRNSCETPEAHH